MMQQAWLHFAIVIVVVVVFRVKLLMPPLQSVLVVFVVFSMRLAFLFSFKFVVRKNNTKNTIRMQNFCKLLCVVALFSLLAGQSRAPNRQYRIWILFHSFTRSLVVEENNCWIVQLLQNNKVSGSKATAKFYL